MLNEIFGDILNVKNGIICHQTNYFGVMGAGIAASIRKVLSPSQYASYKNYCRANGRALLGVTQFLDLGDGRIVANLFCQDEITYGPEQTVTRYDCMRQCLDMVCDYAAKNGLPVYLPYKIGCGIARGDWRKVTRVIKDVFSRSEVYAYIVRRVGD